MAIWKITPEGPVEVSETKLEQEHLLEEHLEDWILADHALLGERLLIIGRQVMIPDVGDRLDILAIDAQGKAVIIELKRGAVKDPVDMQALRYASYIAKWRFEDFERQARMHLGAASDPEFNFNECYEQFCTDAGVDEVPDLNADQRLIIVGSEVRAKLGTVALWLREHNVDIKVIEMRAYREGKTLFLQPQTIVPLPVSRFRDTGRPPIGDGARPWIEDGKAWHLDKRCSPQTRAMFLQLDDLIRDNFEVDDPRWNQKFYVVYRLGNTNWLFVHTRTTLLRMQFLVKTGALNQSAIAQRLGIEEFDKDDSLAERLGLPSSVVIQQRNDAIDYVTLRLKEEFDLGSDAILAFLQDAYDAFGK